MSLSPEVQGDLFHVMNILQAVLFSFNGFMGDISFFMSLHVR